MPAMLTSLCSEETRRKLRSPYFKLFNLGRFKDIHPGGEAFLIGNGPSTRPEILERLGGRLTFCFNRFHLAYDSFSLDFEPTYTVCIDPQIIHDFGREIIQHSRGELLLGTWRWLFFAGGKYTCFQIQCTDPFQFSTDITDFVSTGDSVVVASIQIGYYMGIRRFYLYGVDHNFRIRKMMSDGLALGEGNHFIPNYRSSRPWNPPRTRQIEQALVACRRFLLARGGDLINCTDGGRLEVLPRQRIESVLEKAPCPAESRLDLVIR